jgi:hypothetical protein
MNEQAHGFESGSSPPEQAPRPRPDFTLYGLKNPKPKPQSSSHLVYSTESTVHRRNTARPKTGLSAVCRLPTRALNADNVCDRCERAGAR